MKNLLSYKTLFFLGAVWLLAAFYAVVVAPDYQFDYYKLPECNKTLTVMRVNSLLSGLQIALIPGEYHEKQIPEQDFILARTSNGFDGLLEFIPTCRQNQIVIHCNEGTLLVTKPSELITAHTEYPGPDDLTPEKKKLYQTILVD